MFGDRGRGRCSNSVEKGRRGAIYRALSILGLVSGSAASSRLESPLSLSLTAEGKAAIDEIARREKTGTWDGASLKGARSAA